jgi:hypothetical protein
MFGFEGMARNLMVLTCTNANRKAPVTVELIPPKSLEQMLRTTASARPKPTSIKFITRQNTTLFESRGEYDKIAAFIDIRSDDQFFAFLQLFQNEELLVRWDRANFEYLLLVNEVSISQFITTFRSQLQGRYEELSYQDVYIRCNELWGR